jgi:hypothetical protein
MKFSMLDLSCDIVQSLRQGIALYANETVAVPVCNILQAPIRSEDPRRNRAAYEYDLSICSTVFSSGSAELVEWLEYHLLLGVDHFFLYNTASDIVKQQHLERQLDVYIRRKVVTLVSWPYMNCARNMETGRQWSMCSLISCLCSPPLLRERRIP